MRYFIAILLIAAAINAFGQKPDNSALKKTIMDFDRALETRDSVALKRLLSDKISYGHSNGWIENKREVIEDLYNGKLIYKKIVATAPEIQTEGKAAWARSVAEIDAALDGKMMSFKLKVLQVWLWDEGRWMLFARQSVPIPKEK